MSAAIPAGMALLNFLAGIGDRAFGQGQADAGRDELRELRGDFQTEDTDPNTGERVIQHQGLTSQIHERLGKDQSDILGTLAGSKAEQLATIDQFDKGRANLGQMTADLGQDILYGTNKAGQSGGSVGGPGGGLVGRESTRQGKLESTGQQIVTDAGKRYQDTVGMLGQVIGRVGSLVDSSITSAKQGLADITAKVTSSVDWAKENLASGLSDYSGQALAATGEAVAGVDSGFRQTLASIDEASGTMPPQQIAMLKAQANQQRTASLMKVGREARATDAANLATIRKNLSDTVASVFNTGNSIINDAWKNLSSTQTAGASLTGSVGTAAAGIQSQASAQLGTLQKDVAVAVDNGAQFMDNLLGQYGQSIANNIVQATAQDIDYSRWVTDMKKGIIDEAAMAETNVRSATTQAAVSAIAMNADITREIAGSFFNWQATMMPFSAITGNMFQDYMQWQQLKMAKEASQPQTDWGGVIGGIASGGLSLAGAAIAKK